MKRFLVLAPALLLVSLCSSQTLDEIVNKSYAASGSELLDKAVTISVEGRATQMGIEMPMVMLMKRPDKIKVTTTYNGMDIIVAYDGQKAYMVNPLMGATDPVELPQDQASSLQKDNMFRNQLLDYFRAGKLVLSGEEDVNGKPAFKIMVSGDEGSPSYIFVDKESYLTVKTTATVIQMGQEMEVETFINEYTDINGVKFPKVTASFVNGMEAGGMTFDKIEIDKPIEDSVFVIK